MPLLKSSASDFTAFVRSAAVLPRNGKVVNSTVTTVNPVATKGVAIASDISVLASPSRTIIVAAIAKSRGNRKGD